MGTGGRSHHHASLKGGLDFPPAGIRCYAVCCQTGMAPPAVVAEHLCCHSTQDISAESDNTSAN